MVVRSLEMAGTNNSMEEGDPVPLLDVEDEGDDRSFVEEAAEIALIVKRIVNSEGKDAELVYDRWKQIVSDATQLSDTLHDALAPHAPCHHLCGDY